MARFLSQGLNTIEELQNAAYAGLTDVNKAAGPLVSNTAGTFNTTFGAEAWMQLNEKSNLFGTLAKKPFQQSGFRIETSYPATLGTGGTAETGGIPASIMPVFAEASLTLKRIQHSYDDSDIKEIRFASNDDDLGINAVRKSVQAFHVKTMNKMLSADAGLAPAGNNLESIDRVISNQAQAVADVGNELNYSIYGFVRQTSTAFDSNIVSSALGLVKGDIRSLLSTIDNASGDQISYWICNNTVADLVEALYETQIRYNGAARLSVGVNGVQTNAGDDAQFTVSQIGGYPLIRDADIPNNFLYAINSEFIWIEVGMPTQNEESAERLLTGVNGTKGIFTSIMELKCVKPTALGKITGAAFGPIIA